MSRPEYSVYWWDRDGNHYRELHFVEAKRAAEAAHRLAEGPASVFGFVERIMITDGGGFACFEWLKGKGYTTDGRVYVSTKEVRK